MVQLHCSCFQVVTIARLPPMVIECACHTVDGCPLWTQLDWDGATMPPCWVRVGQGYCVATESHPMPQGGSTLVNTIAVTIISFLVFLVIAGCGTTNASLATPTGSNATPAVNPTNLPTPVLRLPNEPVSFSRVKTEFGQPLSSGLSLPDMVENALRSIVEIQTTFGGGSGFIINSDGLVVTNKHVIEGASRVTLRETSGNSFGADVVGGHPTLDLA